jgi:hypothetical protein
MATKYRVQGPDGAIHVFEGPDDATPVQIETFAAQTFGAAPAVPSGASMPVGRKGVAGIPGYDGPVPAAPKEPAKRYGGPLPEALMAPIETAVTLGTGLITAPIVEASKIGGTLFSGKYGTQQGIKAGEAVGRKVQEFFQPAISPTAQSQVESIGNALANTGLQGVPLNMMSNMATLARPAIQQVAPTIKAPIEARQQRVQAERIRQSELNAPRIDAVKDALDLGLALDPALSNPGAVTRIKSGAVGSTGLQGNLSKLNLPQAAKIARDDLGLPETIKLDAKAYETARNVPAISDAYNKVRSLPRVDADSSVMDDIDRLRITPVIGDTGQAAAVNSFIDTVQSQLQSGATGATTVDSIRQLRRNAQAIYNQQNAGINPPSPEAISRADVNIGIARALETAIENSITDPMLVTDFRNARTALARTYDYERATNLATGAINPQALATLAAEGRPLSGKLAKLANVAANFPETMQGGVVREPTFREKATRSGAAGTAGAILGSPFGLPGAIIGGGVGAATGNIASALAARRMATPAYQRANAMPADYRPIPSGANPAEINYAPGQMVPYDYSQQTFTPPNFVMQPNQYGPRITPVAPEVPPTANMLGYGGTMETLAAERARAAGMSRTLGQQAETQQAAAEAATRRPTSGAVELQINPLTGLPEIAKGIKGATPAIIEGANKAAVTAAEKMRLGRAFDMTAVEKVQWGKSLLEGMPIAQGEIIFGKLTPQQITGKMQDRAWVDSAITKARQEAQAFDQIATRAADARAKSSAIANRERMLDLAEQLQDALSARPVQRSGQGPKTRAFQRNMLRPDDNEIQNALTK